MSYYMPHYHTPVSDPREDEEQPDVKHPPVPPDQEPDVIPVTEPPKPGEHTPMRAWRDVPAEGRRLV